MNLNIKVSGRDMFHTQYVPQEHTTFLHLAVVRELF